MKITFLTALLLGFVFTSSGYASETPQPLRSFGKSCIQPESNQCFDAIIEYLKKNSDYSNIYFLKAACTLGNKKACATFIFSANARSSSFWNQAGFRPGKPIFRLTEDSEIVDLLKAEMSMSGKNPSLVNSKKIDPSQLKTIEAAAGGLEKKVLSLVRNRLAGVLLANNFGSSAISYTIRNEKDEVVAYFIILDSSYISMNANEWGSKKERAVFSNSTDISIQLGAESLNSATTTIEFILLHEIGHLISILDCHTPEFLDEPSRSEWKKFKYATKMGWSLKKSKLLSTQDTLFPERTQIIFYGDEPKLSNKNVINTYKNSRSAGFPSLQSAVDVNEDFADSFAIYIHSVLLGRPYEVSIREPSGTVTSFSNCFKTKQCKKRAQYFEALLK